MKYLKLYEYFNFNEEDFDFEEEDDTIIPEKWEIKVTRGNIKILQSLEWGTWNKNYRFTIGGYYHPYRGDNKSFGREEITIDQFMKIWKLRENFDWTEDDFDYEEEDYSNKIPNKKFLKFLIDNDTLDKFIHEFNESDWNSTLYVYIKDCDKSEYIVDAFPWHSSPYWKSLNQKWKHLLNNF